MNEKHPKELILDEIEEVEKLTLRWIFQAITDFGMEAHEVFLKSPDRVKDIAEDITRELLDRLAGYNVPQRIYGTVDYKKARYIIMPEQTVRQALFIDSKAEKENRSATIQMSQTSMRVRQKRSDSEIDEKGFLPEISKYGENHYLTTTSLVHFKYQDTDNIHHLQEVTIASIPNGLLQHKYNPTYDDNIWLAGRNAPTLGEDFRVRLSFAKLKSKASWRVQRIFYNESFMECTGQWDS
ncbi:BglI family type II restriction endonuclease [Desulfonema magnum]|uniref:Restriction endonuclease type II n=1 Tax=Desulfonema magnum TaxID=45655 RepID=A0A975GSL6_9BACT|nr:BglI family type II restriction endonuclease [Desulfonema magnum]QTA92174.1 Restriction endonuclease type II [Desulfonema magnum]